MAYTQIGGNCTYRFDDLKMLMAKASPARSGDSLAGIAAATEKERMAAQMALAEVPLTRFLEEALVPYEEDEVTRLIFDSHDRDAFIPISHMTVGDFRDWLLSSSVDGDALTSVAAGITPEMAAAVSKLMRNQDLILVAQKCRIITRFRNTIGLPGRLSVRLQPNHPTDDVRGIAASMLDGLLYGCGDAVIGINPATDSLPVIITLLNMVDEFRAHYEVPTQSCVLTHVTNTIQAIERGAPVDLVFQSIAGTEKANASFGFNLALLREAQSAALSLNRGTVGTNVMYFETGQGSALSANAHHDVDQQTCEARAYAVARAFQPLLTNTVVGFIGPEYLYNGKQELAEYVQTTEHVSLSPSSFNGNLLRIGQIRRTGLQRLFQQMLMEVSYSSQLLLHQSSRHAIRSSVLQALSEICLMQVRPDRPSSTHISQHSLVCRIREYVVSRGEDPVAISDICRDFYVSRRTLQNAFHSVVGMSPVAFLRAVRLNGVRRMLRDYSSGVTCVQDAAARWGFWHLSQFASDYRKLFGERPSDSLRQRCAYKGIH